MLRESIKNIIQYQYPPTYFSIPQSLWLSGNISVFKPEILGLNLGQARHFFICYKNSHSQHKQKAYLGNILLIKTTKNCVFLQFSGFFFPENINFDNLTCKLTQNTFQYHHFCQNWCGRIFKISITNLI